MGAFTVLFVVFSALLVCAAVLGIQDGVSLFSCRCFGTFFWPTLSRAGYIRGHRGFGRLLFRRGSFFDRSWSPSFVSPKGCVDCALLQTSEAPEKASRCVWSRPGV